MLNKDTFNPLVSVYIPTYNRVELLKRAVESVRTQSYKNLEIIIVDDCSTDNTHQYLENISKLDPRIKFYIKDTNSGACVSRNIAINRAKGLFITGLDDDDYFHPNRIEVFIKNAQEDPDKIYFSSYNVKRSKTLTTTPSKLIRLKKTEFSHKDLLKKNPVSNQIFVKTEYLKRSGGFDKNMKAWQDLECWYNLIKTQKIKAHYIKKATQTVDMSHDHERVSTQKIANIRSSYEYFAKKHKLNPLQKFVLEGQLIRYEPQKYSKLKKTSLLLLTGNYFLLKNLLGLA